MTISAHGAGIETLFLQFPELFEMDEGYSFKSSLPSHIDLLSHIAQVLSQSNQEGYNLPIPSGAVYLGQLMAHDVLRTEHRIPQLKNTRFNRVRRPFMLDSLYGDGPDIAPHLYDEKEEDGIRPLFRDGSLLKSSENAPDLPRHRGGCPLDYLPSPGVAGRGEPIIADRRNDSHLILSQLVGVWMRLHNFIFTEMSAALVEKSVSRSLASKAQIKFRVTQDAMRAIWHNVVERDVFPNLLHPDFRSLAMCGRSITDPPPAAVVALRATHSLVRSTYFFVSEEKLATLSAKGVTGISTEEYQLSKVLGSGFHGGFAGFGLHNDNWAISWSEFFDDVIRKQARNRTRFKLNYTGSLNISSSTSESEIGPLLLADILREEMLRKEYSETGKNAPPNSALSLYSDDELNDRIRSVIRKRFRKKASSSGDLKWRELEELLKDLNTLPLPLLILGEAEFYCDGRHLGKYGSALLSPWLLGQLNAAKSMIHLDQESISLLPQTFANVVRMLKLD